jgi:hypothetical protein
MSWAWVIPAAIAGLGVLVMMVVAHRTAEQARGLRRDLDRVGDLRPALVEVRDEMAVTAEAVRRLRGRR